MTGIYYTRCVGYQGSLQGQLDAYDPYSLADPLPDEYDLLIYAKNGHRPMLLEHLAEVFPRQIQIHYGQYQREQFCHGAGVCGYNGPFPDLTGAEMGILKACVLLLRAMLISTLFWS